MTGCSDLIEPALRDAFSDSISIRSDAEDCMIQFPFVRPDGDPIRLWVIEDGGSYIVSDEGETYGMLYLSGIDVETESREKRINAVKRRFGLDAAMFEIQKSVTDDELGRAVLDVYEAVSHIASLSHSRRPYAQDDFREVISNYFDEVLRYSYRTNVSVNGFAEAQTLDFELLNTPSPTYVQAIRARSSSELHRKSEDSAYKFYQVKRVDDSSQFFSLVDDERGVYSENQMKPLFADSDRVIRWSDREQISNAISV